MLALALAEDGDGLIDLLGALQPPFGPLHPAPETLSWENPALHLPLPAIREYMAGMRGRVIEIAYMTANDRPWIYHVVDTEFLRSWLDNPDFHMIK
jgi:hypothetical protein